MLFHDLASDIQGSETKPLYISKISIDGDNSLSPLSGSVYKAILDQTLSHPVQNVGSSLYTFGDIRRKLLCTGLYQDVRITLEQDHDAKSSEFANKDSPKEYGIESPLATHARIILKPSGVYNSTAGTTSLVDDSASVAISRSYMNLLGRADSESFHLGLKYNPQTSKWEGKSLKGSFSLPLAKNPSVRASLNFDGVKVNQRSKSYNAETDDHDEMQYSLSTGLQKRWILEQTNSVPNFYAGITSTNRDISGLGAQASKVFSNYSGKFNKVSLESKFHNDTRKYYGTFPVSGYELLVNNEYVISQTKGSSQVLPQEDNFSKFDFSLQHHTSHWKNKLTNSLDLQFGGIIPFSEKTEVHPMDKWYLGGLDSMKGFQTNGVGFGGNSFFYKVALTASQKLINTPIDSPLRLNFFMNLGNAFNDLNTATNSYAAATGISLTYKTPQANMDLTYAHPLTSRSQDITKPGFSFGVTFSYF